MDNRPPIASAVIVKDGRVLLTRRRQREGALLWALPGGAIEGIEAAQDAAVREVFEETGLVVAARHILGSREHPATNRHIMYVACAAVAGKASVVDGDELDAVEWIDITHLNEYVPQGFYEPVQKHIESARVD